MKPHSTKLNVQSKSTYWSQNEDTDTELKIRLRLHTREHQGILTLNFCNVVSYLFLCSNILTELYGLWHVK